METRFYEQTNVQPEDVIGFIDWDGIFYPCSYGQHSELAFSLAKKLLKDDSWTSEKKIEYGLVKISRSGFLKDSEFYYCYLPKSLNDKQIEKLKEISVENEEKLYSLSYAIQDALEMYFGYPDILNSEKECVFKDGLQYLKDESDYGITGSSHPLRKTRKERNKK